jgi:hypothetical protein
MGKTKKNMRKQTGMDNAMIAFCSIPFCSIDVLQRNFPLETPLMCPDKLVQ